MDLKFVCAQPDVPYFHWQAKVFIKNFIDKGINPDRIHLVFGMWETDIPTEEAKKLTEFGVNVHFYKDERKARGYIASIKPYLISKWLEEFPNYGDIFFLHDSDIVFRELPDYSKYLQDDICYVADTRHYIGYKYIDDCCKRHEQAHPNSERLGLLKVMSEVVGIDIETIQKLEESSGGGQYIIKNLVIIALAFTFAANLNPRHQTKSN
jgi:hypothetical protein